MLTDSAFLVLVNVSLLPAAEVEMATSVMRPSSTQSIERKHDLASLSPKLEIADMADRFAMRVEEREAIA